jgi:hypothetical protein
MVFNKIGEGEGFGSPGVAYRIEAYFGNYLFSKKPRGTFFWFVGKLA